MLFTPGISPIKSIREAGQEKPPKASAPPSTESESVQRAAAQERQRLGRARGFRSTILSDFFQTGKTLLGQ